jgi:hypothetical protein
MTCGKCEQGSSFIRDKEERMEGAHGAGDVCQTFPGALKDP